MDKIGKRDNSTCRYLQGVPMYSCNICKKHYQTKKLAEQHMRRKHE
jgi:hypothetical protein